MFFCAQKCNKAETLRILYMKKSLLEQRTEMSLQFKLAKQIRDHGTE